MLSLLLPAALAAPSPPVTPAPQGDDTASPPLSDAPASLVEDAPVEEVVTTEVVELPRSSGGPGPQVRVDLTLSSAYASRGIDVFADGGPSAVRAALLPSVGVCFGGDGPCLAWASAWQLSGADQADHVAEGIGAENDLAVSWGTDLGAHGRIDAAIVGIAYPFANPADAGVVFPLYLEPGVALGLSGAVDVSLEAVYSTNLQPALSGGSYLYVHPGVARAFPLPAALELTAGAGAGFKAWTTAGPHDNTWDVHVDLEVARDLGAVRVTPGLHAAWTDRRGQPVWAGTLGWAGVSVSAGG